MEDLYIVEGRGMCTSGQELKCQHMYIGKTETVVSISLKLLRESVKVFQLIGCFWVCFQWYWMLGYFCGLGESECFYVRSGCFN